jgi:hypothetical protein
MSIAPAAPPGTSHISGSSGALIASFPVLLLCTIEGARTIGMITRVLDQHTMMLSFIDVFCVLAIVSFLPSLITLLIGIMTIVSPVEFHFE